MAEYIERERVIDALERIDWYHINDRGRLILGGSSEMETYVPFKAVEDMLESIPAADVRPVVLCAECRHRDPEDHKCDSGQTERQGCPFPVHDDYFCAYGVKREES